MRSKEAWRLVSEVRNSWIRTGPWRDAWRMAISTLLRSYLDKEATRTLPQELEELLYAGHAGVGSAAQRHDLPQQDAEAPHVRLQREMLVVTCHRHQQLWAGHAADLDGVSAVEQGLGRHPLDRQPAVPHLAVVVVTVHVSRQPEV